MAVTSEWSWVNIDRAADISVTNTATLSRSNWSMTRFRISNNSYRSELGSRASYLYGKNGGIDEVVTRPQISVFKFSKTTSWTTSSTQWMQTSYFSNGYPVYTAVDGFPNNVIYLAALGGATTWCCVAHTLESILDGSFLTVPYGSWTGYSYVAGTNIVPIYGLTFSNVSGTFTGTGAVASGLVTGSTSFICSADNQVYNDIGVDWYTQTQTWIYKDAWRMI